ncbi:MAG: hypothetical protein JXA66_06080 [Oligoflexia bacterium]|nr:hypothetical protein [Oligoflexia bacterium]
MRLLKGYLQALSRTNNPAPYLICIVLLCSCAHRPQTAEIQCGGRIIKQKLKIKIYDREKTNRLTVYTQISRENRIAVFNGIGSFNRHVFKLEISGNTFNFEEYIDNTHSSGNLSEFKMLPVNSELIFKKLDISQKQPIEIVSKNGSLRALITVLEQTIE